MYNKRKFNKVNDKKVLHKVKKQWVVLSLSMLAMIGAGGAIATQTHANTVNAPQVQEKHMALQQAPNVGKGSTPAKPVIKLSAQAQKTPVSTTNNGNKGKQLSLSDDASNAVHQTPSIDDIISAVDSDIWNSQYGSKYTDLLSNLNYNNVHVFDNPTAYNNSMIYNNDKNSKNNGDLEPSEYLDALTSVKQDLSGFSAYPKVQALQNLINTTTTNPSTYSPIFSNPLFNGFETTFNNNDANTYNVILNDFSNLETDRNNNNAQASDLQNALNGLNSLSDNAKEAVTKFYGISSFDISNEIDRLNNGYTPQEMVYQPIELKYYDIASKTDPNASNEHVAVSRTPIETVTLNESNFGKANPYTLISNPNFDFNNVNDYPRNYINAPYIANSALQVPDNYTLTGLNSSDVNGGISNGVYLPGTISINNGEYSLNKNTKYENARSYYTPTQQQLHFHLIPQSEASQSEIVNAYVRKSDNDNSVNDVHSSNQYFSTEYLKNNTNNDNCSNDLEGNIYGKYDGTTLYLGGDFSQYCAENTNDVQQSKKCIKESNGSDNTINYQSLMAPNLANGVTKIVLEDSTGLYGSLYNMFANMPHLQSVVRAGNFDSTYGEDGPYDISYMFANDPELTSIQDDVDLPWDFYDNDKGGVGTDDAANNTFAKDYSLTDISGLSNWRMSGFTKMNGMFYNDSSLSDFSPISNWDVGGVHQMNDTFSNDAKFSSTSLQELSSWNLRGLETAERLFSGDTKISNISPWMDKPIGTGTTYPDVVDAFRNTGLSFNNNPDSSNPEWILLGNDIRKDSWLPKMYRTEDGHYSFTPDSNTIYFGDPFGSRQYNTPESFNGAFYKNDGYLVLTSIDYTWSSKPNNDGSGNVTNSDIHVNKYGNEISATLPSRPKLIEELNNNGINLSNIHKINLVGYFGIPELDTPSKYNNNYDYSLNGYFANLPNLQSIQGGAALSNNWYTEQNVTKINDNGERVQVPVNIPVPVDVSNLFANDYKLDSVIGFFGNEQALKEDPDAGIQAQGLIHTGLKSNLIENATSTAHMFDGDKSLFNDDNAQANIDAISSIPMDNITNASYMFNNTGLNDSNIVTNWNLSNLRDADHMFNGCNLTNLNGFGKLGNWHNFYTNSTDNPTNSGEWSTDFNPDATDNPDNNTDDESHSDSINKVELSNLRNASNMFANNPSLDDGVTAIENGNNNWKFDQAPTVDHMFSNTDVGYDEPTVNASNGGYVLGAKPKYYTNKIDFNGDSSANTTVYGELGSTHNENVPQGYHYVNGSNGQFTINNEGTHTFNVAPDAMSIPVEFKDSTNGQFLGLNPTANGQFTVNTPKTLSLNNEVLSQLHQQGYQLSSNNNYNFTITPKEVNNSGNLYPGYEPTLNVTPINFSIPVEYKDVEKGITKSVNPITNQTIHSTPDLTQYAQQHVPSGYQLVTNDQNNDLLTWKIADHIKSGSNNTDTLVVYMEPVQAKAEVKYIGNNGAVNPNPSVISSGDEYSSTKVGHTPVGLPNGYTITNPNQSVTYNNQAQNVNVTPESFNVPFNVVTPSNSNVLFHSTSANKVTVDSSANLELPMMDINNTLHNKGYVLNNPNTNFTLKHGDITNANKFNVEDTPSFAASDISATLPIKFENTENHNQVVGNIQTISGVKANTQNNISSKMNVPTNYQLASGNVDLTKYSFNNANLGADNELSPLVVHVYPAQQQALVIYKDGNTPVNATPISLGSGDTSALNLASSKFEIGAHPSILPSGYQISNPNQVMYYNNQLQDVAVTPIQATSTVDYKYNSHDVTDKNSTKSVTGNQSVGKMTFDLASLTVPNGYQLAANNPATDSYKSGHVTVNVTPVQATDGIIYKNGSQTVSGDSNSTNSVKGNKVIAPNSFNTNSLALPNGYKLVGNGTTYTYNGNPVEVQVAPKSTTTTIHYEYNGQPLTTTTKHGLYNASFDTKSLSLPNGYNLENGNQTVPDNNANVDVNLVPQQKTDTINFVYNKDRVATTYVSGNSSATRLPSSHFIVGNTPNGLPSGYQVENPSQVINYDGTNHTIMIKPVSKPTPKPNVTPNSQSNSSKPNNPATPANTRPASSGSKPSSTSSASTNTSKNNSSTSSSASNSNVKPTSNSTNSSASHNASSASTNNPKSNGSTSSDVQPSSANSGSTNSSASTPKNNSSASSTSNSTTSTNNQKSSGSASSTASNSTQPSSNASNASSTNTPKSNGSTGSSKSMNSSAKSSSTNSSASNTSNASSASTNIPESASSTTPIMPITPMTPNSNVSPNSVANTSTSSNSINNTSVESVSNQSNSTTESKPNSSSVAKPYKTRTNRGYVIQHNANHNNRDVVTYHGHKHIVHYNADGKNTIRVRERVTKNGKRIYHYKNVVVSTNLPTNNTSKAMIQAIDMINFNKPAKYVWSWKSANKVLNQIKVGEVVSHYGTKMARISVPAHYRYFIINNKALAHLLINKVGNAEKHAIGLKRNLVFRINRIIVLHGKRGNYVRYEFKFNKRNFWVTANSNYVKNAYLQVSDVKGRKIKVTRKCCLYTSPKYNKHTFIRSIKPGVKLTVKKVIFLGRKSNYQTRLLLSNGDYITANKQFVKVI